MIWRAYSLCFLFFFTGLAFIIPTISRNFNGNFWSLLGLLLVIVSAVLAVMVSVRENHQLHNPSPKKEGSK